MLNIEQFKEGDDPQVKEVTATRIHKTDKTVDEAADLLMKNPQYT